VLALQYGIMKKKLLVPFAELYETVYCSVDDPEKIGPELVPAEGGLVGEADDAPALA
jgi:hypothetical protein